MARNRLPEARAKAFMRIYAHDLWNGGSGPGSTPEGTVAYVDLLTGLIQSLRPKSVVDFGCGDWQFSQLVDWSNSQYLGFDVVPSVVSANKSKFETEHIKFQVCDFVALESFPPADLYLCKDVLQHLPNQDVVLVLQKFAASDATVLITNDIVSERFSVNMDIHPGDYRPIDLSREPFNAKVREVLRWDSLGFLKQSVILDGLT